MYGCTKDFQFLITYAFKELGWLIFERDSLFVYLHWPDSGEKLVQSRADAFGGLRLFFV